ncbi:MAG: putative structural protein [Prokaryotic dsDNA virus sp.]|nr:MAG: putative structural protein [Prokaryotic dsDNA virus sp.]|tara:strand:- start:4893 stop:6239 length:1347 start_codon:yes stop_codon:yes gene_type:complete
MAVTMTGVGGALTPSPTKSTLSTNYLGSSIEFTSQYLPEVYEAEFEKYGNRTVSSFLRQLGAEMPFASDVIQWAEQGRLHLAVTAATRASDVISSAGHPFRLNQTVVIIDGDGDTDKAIITDVDAGGTEFTVASYSGANLNANLANSGLKVFAFGSEFKKGTNGMTGSLEAPKDILTNSPIIIKDKYEVNGSDMAQIGWIEVTTEKGTTGYLWYLKSEHETRLRFEDYMELSLVEGRPAASSSGADTAGYKGTKGLFYELENRGNIATGTIDSRDDIEEIIKILDKEGAIQENALFVNRTKSFEIDTVLAAQNNSGASTSSYGLFDNDEDMALNLGFKGFNLGYDFYKTDWKYLNDPTTGGLTSAVDGVLVPAGTTSIYDQVMGRNATRPFLHVKFRKNEAEDRKYKSWVVGSAGPSGMSSDLDAMQVHFLSERALCVHGANNFILMQ